MNKHEHDALAKFYGRQGKPKYSEKKQRHCQFIDQKSHMDCPVVDPGHPKNLL